MSTQQMTGTQTDVGLTTPRTSLTMAHWGTLSLAAVTGVIHLYLYLTDSWLPFLLAGAGFLCAIGLFFLLKDYRRYLYLAGVPYTIVQIGGYLMVPMGPLWLGALDKAVQVAFIAGLVYLYFNERKQAQVA